MKRYSDLKIVVTDDVTGEDKFTVTPNNDRMFLLTLYNRGKVQCGTAGPWRLALIIQRIVNRYPDRTIWKSKNQTRPMTLRLGSNVGRTLLRVVPLKGKVVSISTKH